MRSDEWLMERVQSGEERALGELLSRYRGRLLGFLVRRSPDPDSAEDLFQETWLRVVRSRASFDPKRRFSTWLFQIANNLCRDRARRRAVAERHTDMLRSSQPADARANEASLDLRLDIHRRLAMLPEPYREVLILRYYNQFSEREIAETVGIPSGTVKSRLHSAVRRLRGQETD